MFMYALLRYRAAFYQMFGLLCKTHLKLQSKDWKTIARTKQ